jgi:hypothetical protein
MSETPTSQSSEQIELLREIRDILVGQTQLVDQQWAESKEMGDRNRRINIISSCICVASVVAMVLLAILLK